MEHALVEQIALIAGLGLFAQWLAWRFHVPAIVLLAVAGLVAGPVTGWLDPEADFGALMRPAVGTAVAVILFEGGLNLNFRELKRTGRALRGLVLIGVPVAWILGSLAAHAILGLSWGVALILGAILVVTGPTVVIPLLRQAKLSPQPASLIKWEGIINDPIGALLAVVVFRFLVDGYGVEDVNAVAVPLLAVASSAAIGFAAGRGTAFAFQRGYLPEFLKGPAVLGLVLVCYAAGNVLQPEAGLVAVTVLGVTIANTEMAEIEHVRRVKEYLVVVLVSAVFVVLSATLDRQMLSEFDWRTAVFLTVLLLVVRPATVFLATIGSGLEVRQRILVGWIAPRGIVAVAVAGLFAPLMVEAGYEDAELIVPLVFAVVFTTVVAHGFSLRWLGRRLGLAAGKGHGVLIVGGTPWSNAVARALHEAGVRVLVTDRNWYHMEEARGAKVPTYSGELLSELAQHHLDLTPYDHVVAASENDAYNALICRQFAREIGRSNTYQIAARTEEAGAPRAFRAAVRGQTLIDDGLDFSAMDQRVADGWTFAVTEAVAAAEEDSSEEAPPDERPPDDVEAPVRAMSLAAIRGDGGIVFNNSGLPFKPQPGDRVLIFAPAD